MFQKSTCAMHFVIFFLERKTIDKYIVYFFLTGFSFSHRNLVCLINLVFTIYSSLIGGEPADAEWRPLIGSLDSVLKRTFRESSACPPPELKSIQRTHLPKTYKNNTNLFFFFSLISISNFDLESSTVIVVNHLAI